VPPARVEPWLRRGDYEVASRCRSSASITGPTSRARRTRGTPTWRHARSRASYGHGVLGSAFLIWAWCPRERLPHMGMVSSGAPSPYGR
jgi:hypothetical protein